jgi:hypothetical protein
MTKSWEQGDNEFVDLAKREAARTGRDAGEILAELMRAAKAARDADRKIRIGRAQKFLKFRNKKKRRGN